MGFNLKQLAYWRAVPVKILCPYLHAVLEREPHVIFAVDRGEVHKAVPEPFVEVGYKSVLPREFGDEGFHRLAPRFLIGDKPLNLVVPSLGGIEPPGQTLVAFLVFLLVEGYAGVLLYASLDKFGYDSEFPLQSLRLGFKGDGREERLPYRREVGDNLVLVGE